ncbi:hypothetical protein M427DRAFT_36481 [Gonapodya prolifera JEL478]|uniref:RING-type domain-containing protein n=1 Tax=Gonapodya prolifera (strain JEL478) TaxID=1344416 RepID=A0A139A2B3_GONPJ|nr:hypothetical protein M427DRAFT_36481 [Gonapodya prolifera JEL478]|eukprot:KXS10874.1 hypothetical protein M427DRAFT_36481 [Gonapodya prolifera JEL478]
MAAVASPIASKPPPPPPSPTFERQPPGFIVLYCLVAAVVGGTIWFCWWFLIATRLGRPRLRIKRGPGSGLTREFVNTLPSHTFVTGTRGQPDLSKARFPSAGGDSTDTLSYVKPQPSKPDAQNSLGTVVLAAIRAGWNRGGVSATPQPDGVGAGEELVTLRNSTLEECAVCLQRFKPTERVRRLPCSHDFHADCVDPWLLDVSALCPLCKQDVRPADMIAAMEAAAAAAAEGGEGGDAEASGNRGADAEASTRGRVRRMDGFDQRGVGPSVW